MIRMITQDMKSGSPRCPNSCNRFQEFGCPSGCTLRFRVAFSCPHCKVIRCFYGSDAPKICTGCSQLLPDIDLIKSTISDYSRIKYHVEEGE